MRFFDRKKSQNNNNNKKNSLINNASFDSFSESEFEDEKIIKGISMTP